MRWRAAADPGERAGDPANGAEFAVRAAADGLGIACVPDVVAAPFLRSGSTYLGYSRNAPHGSRDCSCTIPAAGRCPPPCAA